MRFDSHDCIGHWLSNRRLNTNPNLDFSGNHCWECLIATPWIMRYIEIANITLWNERWFSEIVLLWGIEG